MKRRLRQLWSLGLYFVIPALGAAAPLLVIPIISSRFGVQGWASIAVAQSVGGAVAIVAELGWGVVGPQRVAQAQDHATRASIYRSAIATKILTVCLLAPAAGLLASQLNGSYRLESALVAAGVALGALTPTWFFIGEGKPTRVLLADSLPRVLVNLLSALAIWLGTPLLVYGVAVILMPLASVQIARRIIGSSARLSRQDFRSAPAVIRQQLLIALGRSISVVYTTLPVAMVAAVAPGLVPVFAASERLMRMALTLLTGFPSRLQSWIGKSDGAERVRRSRQSIKFNVVLGVVCGAGFACLAPWVATFVFAGTIELPNRVAILAGLLLGVICSSRGLGLALVARGRANLITAAIAVSAISGSITIIPLALVLGVVGPILGELVAELVGVGSQIYLLRRRIKGAPDGRE